MYLYVNEPRAMPEAFFARRPDMAGVREGDHRALCTSNPWVRDWMSNALAHVFREVPGLGGGFTITASENLTNCASHGQQAGCPRCQGRKPAEVIAEVNTAIAAGIHRGSPQAKLLAWDWGWPDSDAIGLLPKDVWLMSVSEWSLPIERGGVKNTVGEYSLSAPGPGPRATAHWKIARAHVLKTAAKLQINNTWELSAVPWLPVLDLVAEHCAGLAKQQVDGVMLSWSLVRLPLAQPPGRGAVRPQPESKPRGGPRRDRRPPLRREPDGESPRGLESVQCCLPRVPLRRAVLYNGPQQFGPANLLFASPTGYHAT